MYAGRAAWQAGWSAFNARSLVPSQDNETWGDFGSRLSRYVIADRYYTNEIYINIDGMAAALKYQGGLYKHIRGIYNPVERLVDFYPANVYGGNLDLKDMKGGAIPIVTDNPRLKPALRRLWKHSNWATEKTLFVRRGALYGDTIIKIVDDHDSQKVRMELVHPSRVKDATYDSVNNFTRVVIEYEITRDDLPDPSKFNEHQRLIYTEIIDKDWFETYLNGELFGFYKDGSGNYVSRWPNRYGFVPMVAGKHKNVRDQWGANAFFGSRRKIDELNDQAAVLNDQIRKVMNPIWLVTGAKSEAELDIQTTDKDKIPMVYAGENVKAIPLIAQLQIADGIANLASLQAEIERDMPELSMHHLRDGGNLTAPGVRIAYTDASNKVIEARGNYDDTLIRAHMMAFTIGGMNGYVDYESFTSSSYDDGDLDHTIGDRPLFPDTISLEKKLELLQSSGAPSSAIWSGMGYSQDVIDQWQVEKATTRMIEAQAQQPQIDNQQPQLTDGTTSTQNPPAIRGSKLPSEQATKVKPISRDELAEIAKRQRGEAGR